MSDSEIDTRSRTSSPDPALKAQKRKRPIVAPEEELEIDVNLPEPPSKKAKRKEKKAKTKTTTTTTDPAVAAADGDSAPTKAIDTKPKSQAVPDNPAEQKRSEHGVWIGNLPWSATKDAIRTFFLDHADIDSDSITRLHMPEPAPSRGPQRAGPKPQNKGFAYVDFKTAENVVKAVGVSEKLMTGRAVLIKDAKSFEGRPDPALKKEGADAAEALAKGEKPPSQKVFVGNLTFDVTKDDLEEHFGQAGVVEDVFMATFPDSGKCKGYAWIRFTTVEAAEAAVKGFIFKEPEADDEEDVGSDAEAEEPERAKKIKKEKKRKWFINRLQGRELRCEFAEDAQTRYKKRYGKGSADKQGVTGTNGPRVDRRDRTGSTDEKGAYVPPRVAKMDPDQRQAVRRQKHQDARNVAPGKALATAQRAKTGIVEGTGKKTAFAS
ncbi:hypothetical protein B0A48_16895 [Cryoendolithus antarcticus]|uniref:RRM domain-containing protein n=1 Tax=Cryoendolithus antarcticus TaxID=1507870 RepID=A0A1V8SE32_9PEZI|nr:hypothetical protein B0A48_16895 [Cryoendolithus antarcticus]